MIPELTPEERFAYCKKLVEPLLKDSPHLDEQQTIETLLAYTNAVCEGAFKVGFRNGFHAGHGDPDKPVSLSAEFAEHVRRNIGR